MQESGTNSIDRLLSEVEHFPDNRLKEFVEGVKHQVNSFQLCHKLSLLIFKIVFFMTVAMARVFIRA